MQWKNNTRLYVTLGISGFIVLILGLAVFLFRTKTLSVAMVSDEPITTPFYATPAPTPEISAQELKNKDQLNVLLLGYGGAGHQGGYLTDVMILTHFDLKQNRINLVTIPRDLYLTMHDGRNRKINTALSLASQDEYPTNVLSEDEAKQMTPYIYSAVEQVTGIRPDYFIGIDFDGFTKLVDALGGIEVAVPQSFNDPYYPIKGKELELCGYSPEEVTAMTASMSGFLLEQQFNCRYENLVFEQGSTHMDGSTTLKFVRSRHSSQHGGDFSRSERQQAVLTALRSKLLSLNALSEVSTIYHIATSSIRTNVNLSIANAAVDLLKDVGDYTISRISLSTENVLQTSKSNEGAYILIPQAGMNEWAQTKDFIKTSLNQ